MNFLSQIFTWWNGQTLGTRIFTWRNGHLVGEDEQGNRFYQTVGGKRRWVIYAGVVEASRVAPNWHGWLHHTWAEPPTEKPLPRKRWEKPHQPNLTGTPAAYHPPGSILAPRQAAPRDYEAWTPEG